MSIKNDQYLLFLVGEDTYGVEALKAQEIVSYENITKIPMMNRYVNGITNIRGSIVPVIDMLDRFGIGKTTIGDKTSIVVIKYDEDGVETHMGILIDEVYAVDDISITDVKPVPEFGTKFDKKFISKMCKYEGNYIAILDTQKVLDIKELSKLGV